MAALIHLQYYLDKQKENVYNFKYKVSRKENKKGENKENISVESLAKVLPAVPRHEFEEMQTILLKTVVKMNDVGGQLLPEPILKEDGSFAIEALAYDAGAVIALTVRAFLFNVGGFFGGAGLIPAEPEKKS